MKTWWNFGAAAATVVLSTVASCDGDDGAGHETSPDATADANGGHDGGTSSTVCGGVICGTPTGAEFNQVSACCLENDACGLQAPFTAGCLSPSQPGAFDIGCAPFSPPRGGQMDGCCGPDGCGALNPFMGCLANADLGRDVVACNYDPTNDCAAVAAIPCDGAEDCPSGERCCAESVSVGYARFGCFPSCQGLTPYSETATWVEICHAGDTCENPEATCRGTSSLPSPLGRCSISGRLPAPEGTKNPGEVHCGLTVCGAGEQCCLRNPNEPYCAPATEECRCHPAISDGGP